VTTAVGVVDAIDGRHIILIGLLVIGPGMAIATARTRPTALVSLWAIGFAIALGSPDGIWGTHLEFQYAGAVTVMALISTGVAFLLQHRRCTGLSIGASSPGDTDVQFLTTAYAGILERAPDPQGLDDHLRALGAATSREDVVLAMVQSQEAATLALYRPGIRSLVDDIWRRRSAVGSRVRPICFLHTMKTAGTALAGSLVDLAGPWPHLTDLMLDQLVCLPRVVIHQAVVIAGHLPYEAVDLLPDGMALCTVVREPLERTLSHHAHLNGILAGRGEHSVTLDEFLSAPHYRPLWQNYQARQLVHRVGLRDAWRTFSPVDAAAARGLHGLNAEYPLQSLFDSTPLELASEELEVAAVERLDSIDLVGTTDDLQHLMDRIACFWGRRPPAPVPRTRVSAARVTRDQLAPSLVATIRDGTAVDAAIYERALALGRSA
jgi:hypothetical protein